MLAAYLLVSLLSSSNCLNVPLIHHTYSDELLNCVVHITSEYFKDAKVLTFIGNKEQEEDLLRAVNNANVVSVLSKLSWSKLPGLHQSYLISAYNTTLLATYFHNLIRESSWNPGARFLLLVRELDESEITIIFDALLRLHVNNVLVVNATADAHLYTYNPFDNYNCGRQYDNITSFGKCSQAYSINLYPEKLVTGLRNCTFNVLLTEWPPYAIISPNDLNETSPFKNGVEPYLLNTIGKMLGFDINLIYDTESNYSWVSADMEAVGALKKLQDNEVEMVIGGMFLLPSRAGAFSYTYGHLVYRDEIRFLVRRAENVATWKNIYLEFESTVWILIMLALIFYSILVIILLRTDDKGSVVLILLDNLVLHGRNIQAPWSVKCVLMFWMMFAYLVNTFYQSSLVSLTTHPAKEYQISSEEDIAKFQLQPCLSVVMEQYYLESVQSSSDWNDINNDCYGLLESVATVAESDRLYTIILDGFYEYHEQDFFDKYGVSRIFTLPKPYSKMIYAFYLYKGFPRVEEISHKTLQLKENGLIDKIIRDINYLKQIKHIFRKHEFSGNLVIPWIVYIFGCTISVITFIFEILSKH